MKKVLLFIFTFICSLTIVYAQEEYTQKWMNENTSLEVARHMIQTDDGLIVGGYDHDYKVQLAKYDNKGKEVKTLKLDYEGTVCGFFERDGKYYFVATDDENDWEVKVYEITLDLTIVKQANTGFHLEGWNEQIDLVGNKLYITSTSPSSIEGIYDEDDQYYDYFYIDLNNLSSHHGNSSNYNFNVFGDETFNLLYLNDEGVPAFVVKETKDLVIVAGKNTPNDDGVGFIHFYENNNSDIVYSYYEEEYIKKHELGVGKWYTHVALLDEYVVAAGENYSNLDFFDYNGELVDTVVLAEELYQVSSNDKYIQVDDMIYQDGRLIVAYQACEYGDIRSSECKAGIVVFQKKFNIETRTDGFGVLTVSKNTEYGSEEVVFNVEPIEGYVLKEVKVTDKNGNVIIFTENTFVMPFADVLVEATFEPKNPETLTGVAILGLGIVGILSLVAIIVNVRKAKELM